MKKLIEESDILRYRETVFRTILKIAEIYRKIVDLAISSIVSVYVAWLMNELILDNNNMNSYKRLVRIGPRAVKPLLRISKKEKDNVREVIVGILGDIGDSAAKKALLFDALRDSDENVRNKAAEMLVKTGTLKLEMQLINALKDENEPDRWKAALIMGNRDIREAAGTLINALKDKDGRVRSSSAEALGKIRYWESGPSLINLLKDNDKYVRSKSAEALGKIGFREAGMVLTDTLGDEDGHVRSMAAEALGNIRYLEAGVPLVSAVKDRDEQVRCKAAEALGKIGFREAGTVLTDALRDEDEYVRSSAAEALGNIRLQEAVQPLISIIRDSSEHVRRNTVLALRKIGDREAMQPFITALNDKDYYVRSIAALALGDMNDPVTVMPLVTALRDTEPYTIASAASALGIIGDVLALDPLVFLKEGYKSNLIRTARTLEKTAGTLTSTLEKKSDSKVVHLLDKSFRATSEAIQLAGKSVFPTLDEDQYVRKCAAEAFDKIITANKPFQGAYPNVLCRTCFLRAAKTTSDKYSFVACRHCGRSSYLMENVRQAVGLIGGNIDEYQADDDKVYISLWSEDQKTARNADIDALEIRDSKGISYDYAINAVLVTLKNDVSRPAEYMKGIPVVIQGNPKLPGELMPILEHELKEVIKK